MINLAQTRATIRWSLRISFKILHVSSLMGLFVRRSAKRGFLLIFKWKQKMSHWPHYQLTLRLFITAIFYAMFWVALWTFQFLWSKLYFLNSIYWSNVFVWSQLTSQPILRWAIAQLWLPRQFTSPYYNSIPHFFEDTRGRMYCINLYILCVCVSIWDESTSCMVLWLSTPHLSKAEFIVI